jgi:hypothetical protein
MVLKSVADVGDEGAEAVVWQCTPNFPRDATGAQVFEGWWLDFEVTEQGAEHPHVECGVVCYHDVSGDEVRDDLWGNLSEFGRVLHMLRRQPMNVASPLSIEPIMPGGWFEQPIGRGHQLSVVKEGNAERTGADRAEIGRFKVDAGDSHVSSGGKADRAMLKSCRGLIREDFGQRVGSFCGQGLTKGIGEDFGIFK